MILYSTPTENFMYNVELVTMEDDGSYHTCRQSLALSDNHKPAARVLTLEDYMEIQQRNTKELPDIKKYLTSTPGDPSTYPKSEADIPKDAKEKIVSTHAGESFEGIAYGSGTITQTISHEHVDEKEKDNSLRGVYSDIDLGIGTRIGSDETFYVSAELGVHQHYAQMEGSTKQTVSGEECSGTVVNMPRAAKGYGYDFVWKLFNYNIYEGKDYIIPVVTYIVNDITAPPRLPENITQDFDNTTDSQIALTWTYNYGDPKEFDIYRYEDFPQGGGDKLVGTVAGSDYQIMKDENNNTLTDKDGHVIRQYSFIETDLTADTKYNYRMKVKSTHVPSESIFSPVVEARTDVSTKPDLSLSTDTLTIYPDNVYNVKVNLADPENYQKDINYQWQKYNAKKRKWEDYPGKDKIGLQFSSCKPEDAGQYRCRVNLVRKVEGHPQYISTFTEACTVTFSLRDVVFDDLHVFSGEGMADVNTGVSVHVANSSDASLEKPTGRVWFFLDGPNGEIKVGGNIDEATGIAKINSIEDLIGTTGQMAFVNGGYVVTARYEGDDKMFYPADCPDEYHYLRNIDECIFLSTKSTYLFGEDVAEDAELFDYKKDKRGNITRTDITDKLTKLSFYKVDDNDRKTGNAIATYTLSESGGKAQVPLNKDLVNKAYVEAYMEGETEPAAGTVIKTRKIQVELDMKEKMTGTGDLLEFVGVDDVELSNGIDAKEKNIETDHGKKSLSDYMVFKYYEQNGDFMYDSNDAPDHKDEFIPASYTVQVSLRGTDEAPFYTASYKSARFMVVGNYFLVTAGPKDTSSGRVQMISPDSYIDFEKKGYAGGTKLLLKALPNKGYEIKHWIVNECGENEYTLSGQEKITYSVKSQNTSGTGEIKIQAVMKPKNNTLTYTAKGQGKVTVSPNVASGSGVLADTKLTFTGTPEPGWRFDKWRFVNTGANNVVSMGVTADDGINTKVFTMPDNPVEAYGIFARDTIDILTSNDLEVTYINDGSNPDYEAGAEVITQRGRDVPKGVQVTVRTKIGVELAPGAEWNVTVTTPEGIVPVNVEELLSQGRQACRFTLPEDVVSCAVSTETMQGKYSVSASAEDVDFTISVDGTEMTANTVNGQTTVDGIVGGSQVDIKAAPARGKVVGSWIINGEEIDYQGNTYTANITKNMNVSVTTGADEVVKLTLKAEGGGEGKAVITDKNGEEHEEIFTSSKEVTAYKGESALFSIADSDTEHTLTSVFLDGEYQELSDATFTIPELSADATVLLRFSSNMFYNAAFRKDVRTDKLTVLDEDAAEVEDGDVLTVPKGGTLNFSIVLPEDMKFQVMEGNDILTSYDSEDYEGKKRYYFKMENVSRSMEISVTDRLVRYIRTDEDLNNYFAEIKAADTAVNQPDGILMNDIDMSGISGLALPEKFYAEFNGKGFAIENLNIGSENESVNDFHGLFGDLQEGSCIRDVTLYGASMYVKALPAGNGMDGYSGFLTYTNRGTISRVTIEASTFKTVLTQGVSFGHAGGIAYDNHGVIEFCKVADLTMLTDRYSTCIQCGAVVFNQQEGVDGEGTMTGNYVENLRISSILSTEPLAAVTDLIAMNGSSDKSEGTFQSNYFDAGYSGHDDHGTSVYSITDKPDDEEKAKAEVSEAQFSRKLAYTMNQELQDDIWGVTADNVTKGIYQIIPDAKSLYLAPVKITYVTPNKTIPQYIAPVETALPGSELFGEDTPDAWLLGDLAYAPGTVYGFSEDMTVTGISDMKDFVAVLSDIGPDGTPGKIRYYKNVDDAIRDAMAHNKLMKQELQITGECTAGIENITFDDKTTVTVKNGAALTIRETSQITSSGMIMVEQGAVVHKYGTLSNTGQIVITEGAKFYNYGSAFDDRGTSAGKEYIICIPHLYGEWTYSDEPDDEGRWMKTCTCQVCGKEISEEVEPDPPVTRIESIGILEEPDKTTYEVGEGFTSEGLRVYAKLTDGTKTSITLSKCTLTILFGDEDEALKDGDAMDTEGTGRVTVHYGRFKCGFDVTVINTKDALTVTGPDGKEISKAEMKPGETIALTASLKFKLPYKTMFQWESSDEEVIMLDSYEPGKGKTAIAGKPGTSVIKVTVTDENGKKIEAIEPKTVTISNVSHITELEMLGGDVYLDKGDSHEIKLRVIPEDTTDKVEWSTSDDEVAIVDENGKVTGTGGGTTTVTVKAPDGLTDSRKVYVHEKAKDLMLEPEMLTVKMGGFGTVTARVENGRANGDIVWTAGDMSVCGFYVKNDETGEMEIVDTVTTKLSADGTASSDAYVIIAGVQAGSATVKAEIESETGEMIEKECAVTVEDSDDYVMITHNGASASGKLMVLALDGRYIQLGARSSEEDDSFTWDVIDDEKDPVLKVDSTGGVTLRRKGTGVVRVRSDKNGETDVCMIRVKIDPVSVEISESELNIAKGDSTELRAWLEPEEAEGEITWASSDENVAAVSEDGVVTAVSKGECEITASVDVHGVEPATCRVTVHENPVVVELSDKELMIEKGRKGVLTARLTPDNVPGVLTWTSSDPAVAAVTDEGVITAISEGTATITAAFSEEGSVPAECKVTVYEVIPEPKEIVLSESEITLKKGSSHSLKASIRPEGAKGEITWASSAENIAAVSEDGTVTAISAGSCEVTASIDADGVEPAICRVTIFEEPPEPTGIILSEDELRLVKGGSHTLSATIIPEGATADIRWSSSDEDVAVVSDGKVTAISTGTATITAVPDVEGASAAKCVVTVYEEVVKVVLSSEDVTIKKGDSAAVNAAVTPEGTPGRITWTSSDPAIATVTDKGVVTGLKAGTAVLTASFSKPGSTPAMCYVTVYSPKLTIKISKKEFIYTGKKKIPKITVKSDDTVLGTNIKASNSKVIVMFTNPKSMMPGTYKIAVMARDWYYGAGEIKYKISVKPSRIRKIKKIKNKRGAVKVKWKRVTKKYIKGYQISYSTKKDMSKAESKFVRKWKKTSAVIKGLKAGKKYYFRMRTYTRWKSKTYYSKWSKIKAIK